MGQLYLKGVYYDIDSGGLWYNGNDGSFQEISAGGGPTIYTGDGSLTGDRTVDLNGHSLAINESGEFSYVFDGDFLRATYNNTTDWFHISAIVGVEDFNLQAWDSQFPGVAYSYVRGLSNSGDGHELFLVATSNSVGVQMELNADNNIITYTAATHNLVGVIQTSGTPVTPTATFTSQDGKTVTVTNGLITDVV